MKDLVDSGLLSVHRLLVRSSVTRKYQRRITRRLKSLLGVPDAYGDLFEIARRANPVAVLDVGSHHGATIERFLDDTALRVFGFEPTKESFAVLAERHADNARVSVHRLALADKTGERSFFQNANSQTNSLLDNDLVNEEVFTKYTTHVGMETISTSTLDDWLADNLPVGAVIMKIDIQGAEGLLLDGAQKSMSTRVAAIYSEAQIASTYDEQIDLFELNRRLTQDHGFVLTELYPCMRMGDEAIQTDALWVNPRLMPR